MDRRRVQYIDRRRVEYIDRGLLTRRHVEYNTTSSYTEGSGSVRHTRRCIRTKEVVQTVNN